MINKLKTWIKGFKKVDYEVPLSYDKNIYVIPAEEILEITTKVSELPIQDIVFGIKDYTIEKVDTTLDLLNDIYRTMRPVTFTKVSCEYFRSAKKREIRVTNTIYSLGIDLKIWKFTFKSFFISTCWSTTFDNEFINICNQYTNGFIKANNFRQMLQGPIYVDDIYESDNAQTKYFDGYVKTFGDEKLYQKYGLTDICPTPDENEAITIEESVHRSEIEKFLEDDSMITKVIRRNYPEEPIELETIETVS